MPAARRYQLLCPIARALDRVGDRWALLILRDLHAGPARYSELAAGLPGAASNLLATRLGQLAEDGLIRKNAGAHGVALYELTELGAETAPLLFELARFGARFDPDTEVKETGNRRLIAVTLKAALERVAPPEAELAAAFIVDAETFDLRLRQGAAQVLLTPSSDAAIRIETTYEALAAATDGRLSLADFAATHLKASGPDAVELERALGLMAAALAEIAAAAKPA